MFQSVSLLIFCTTFVPRICYSANYQIVLKSASENTSHNQRIILNKYPEIIIHTVTTEKNIPTSFQVITFLSNVASGMDRPTTPIIKAMAVPIGMPFATNTSTIGTIPAALEYIGTARMVAIGTAKRLSLPIYCSKKPSGTNPCIAAPIPIPIKTYTKTPFTIPQESLTIPGRRFQKEICSSSHSSAYASLCFWIFLTQSESSGSSFIRPRIQPPTIPSL